VSKTAIARRERAPGVRGLDTLATMQLAEPIRTLTELPRGAVANLDVRPLDAIATGTLHLATPDATGRTFVSSASGLAAAGEHTWAISDEYGELVRYSALDQPGELIPGLDAHKHRPDFESIVKLPPLDGAADGATLLAMGSGSDKGRSRALIQAVDAVGAPIGATREVSLKPLYAALDARLPLQPNIEGLAWRDGQDGAELLLFHRGKLDGDSNTIFRLDGAQVLDALRADQPLPAAAIRGQVERDLGSLGGNRLGFADARALPDGRIAFVASAEGGDAIADGVITGSAVGMLDEDLNVTALRPLTGPPRKVEGIEIASEIDPTAPANRYTLVTDADDKTRAAEVLSVDL
jgi:hypothetical protein